MQTDKTVRSFLATNRYKTILCVFLFFSVILFSSVESLHAQTKINNNQNLTEKKQVNGIVKDASGNPMPGVTVKSENIAGIGTVTGSDGRFILNVPKTVRNLIFSFIGMVQQSVSIEKTFDRINRF